MRSPLGSEIAAAAAAAATATTATVVLLLLVTLSSLPAPASSYVGCSSSSATKASVRTFVVEPTTTTTRRGATADDHRRRRPFALGAGLGEDDEVEVDDDEIFTPTRHHHHHRDADADGEDDAAPSVRESTTTTDGGSGGNGYLDDLTPPPVNFARNSILFSENPSTKVRNNPPLTVWRFSRTYLPAIVTGAWPWRDAEALDERPVAALYNVLIVRFPVLSVAAGYLYQKIARGHDLVVDLGFDAHGPQAVPPVVVLGVLILILL